MKLIAGLGNPGQRYARTKHNTGFMTLDYYLKQKQLRLNKNKFHGHWLKKRVKDTDVVLLEPQTDMNLSGQAVAPLAHFFKIQPRDILIIHDDMDLPIGKIRVKSSGKSGGHNGIKSIIHALGTDQFNRLKIGIRHPRQTTIVNWVLTPFVPDQQKLMDAAFKTSAQLLDDFIAGHDSHYLMNKYN